MNTAMRKITRELRLINADGRRKSAAARRVNKKADRRLDEVAKIFQRTIPECCELQKNQLLCRELTFEHCEPVKKLWLLYDVENRFMSVSYNLLLQTFTEAEEEYAYRFTLRYKGLIRARDAFFIAVPDETGKREIEIHGKKEKADRLERLEERKRKREARILETLNDPLIRDKICSLGLVQADLQYFPRERRWAAGIKSMQGSATWILIPPLMQVIRPEKSEIYTMMEVVRMMTSAVSCRKERNGIPGEKSDDAAKEEIDGREGGGYE